MELIHADSGLVQQQLITNLEQYDAIASNKSGVPDNDWELVIDESTWAALPILIGQFIFEISTEWGGKVLAIEHADGKVKLRGPTWRGILGYKVIQPPSGSAYKTFTRTEAHAALADLLGSELGSLYVVSTEDSGIYLSGSYRYSNLLASIQEMLASANARLDISFDGTAVTLQVLPVADMSATYELSDDYYGRLTSAVDYTANYNHIIALGSGEGTAQLVVELTATSGATGIDRRSLVVESTSTGDREALVREALKAIRKNAQVNNIRLDIDYDGVLSLGDIVGGYDSVTGLTIKASITQKILTWDRDGVRVEYKVGD